ncbi:MAG: PA domain-containing protein [Fluviicola sp.]
MKKLILSLATLAIGFTLNAQVVVSGISPAAIQGNYEYTVQANCGQWPGETDDGTWGTWNGGLNFNNAGDFIQGELMLAEDGTPGTNPQGNPISQEACDSVINDLTGKIAVVYRNTCWFSSKIYNAQQAGAIGVIVVNREPGLIGMLGNTDPQNGPLGVDCNIPAVMISDLDGALLVAEMANGPVEMFIGNKLGAFNDDIGAVKGEFTISPFATANHTMYDGFTPGIQVYNYGVNDLPNASVQATIDGPAGNYYDETIPLNLNSGDTAFIFAGNPTEFPAWSETLYDLGDYTLTYTISTGGADDFPFDNEYTAEFKITEEWISLARGGTNNTGVSNSYPSNSTTEYQSCMMLQETNTSNWYVDGMYITPHTDTSVNQLAGAEIFVNAYQWDDGWVDLNDPNYTFDPTTNDAYQNLNLISFGTHYPVSDNEVDQPTWVPFQTAVALQDNVRYLFCIQTFESATISFGYDNSLDYGANYSILAQPVSPVHVDGEWYTAGWAGVSASSMVLHQTTIGLDEQNKLQGNAFPNPAEDRVTISVNTSGNAQLQITDITGKVVYSENVVITNGEVAVNISELASGAYVFNLTDENGLSAQFSVVKK